MLENKDYQSPPNLTAISLDNRLLIPVFSVSHLYCLKKTNGLREES